MNTSHNDTVIRQLITRLTELEQRDLQHDGNEIFLRNMCSELERQLQGEVVELADIQTVISEKEKEFEQLDSELTRKDEIYQTVFENTGTAMMIIDNKGTISRINSEFVKLSGYVRYEIEGLKKWTEFIHSEDVEQIEKINQLDKDNPTGAQKTVEFTFVNKFGKSSNVAASIHIIPGTNRSVISLLDTTALKQAKDDLWESEELFRTLVNNMLDIAVITDWNGTILFANNAAAHLAQVDSHECIRGMNLNDFVHPEHRDVVLQDLALIRKGKGQIMKAYKILLPGNREIWIEAIGTKIRFKGQSADLVTFRNITERKEAEEELRQAKDVLEQRVRERTQELLLKNQQLMEEIQERRKAEQALRESEEKMRTILETAQDSIFIKDKSLKYTFVNHSMEKLFSLTSAELQGITDEELFGENSARQIKIMDQQVLSGVIVEEEVSKPVMDDIKTFHVIKVPMRDAEGAVDGLCGIARDITDRKKAEETLKKKEHELAIKSRSLEEANSALKVLLQHTEEQTSEIQGDVITNVQKLVVPYMEKLKQTNLDPDQQMYMEILNANLTNLISPFMRHMTLSHFNLTPKEVQVASLIKEGKSSNEIGRILNLSPRSIDFHRDNIRQKVGLKNKKANLRSYLLSMS